jgi:F0F1-type ATP synthase delta subunit
MAHDAGKPLVLPTLVFGLVEVRRLRREIEDLDGFLRQMAIRRTTKFEMPRSSRMLDALAAENSFDLLKGAHRTQMMTFLQQVEQTSPSIHMSFAADPSAAFTAKIVGWLRANIDPLVLLQIGLQPTLAAGCVVRTNNKIFDMSLRQRFADQRQLLIANLRGERAS